MCAIYGYFEPGRRVDGGVALLSKMADVLRHRGPDGEGAYVAPSFGFGHLRLALVGGPEGKQPLAGCVGSDIKVVCAGEIFNHAELRRSLESEGHIFNASSDCETIAHLFEKEGIACLRRLNGQFAIAIWDQKRGELHLARDRFGIAPLFYSEEGRRLVFASEMKGVVAFPGSRRELDPHGIDQIFTFWAASAPDTPLKGVRELPPGRYLRVSADGIEEKIYWELSFAEDTRPGGSNASKEAEEILSLLSDAVRLRLGADAPVAGYLSGGLDSSLIAALAKKTNTSFETFSIGFSDPRFDETHERNFAAASLGLPNHSVVSTPAAVAESFEGAVYSAERPVLRPAFVPMKALSASARAGGFKAVIAGEGADEFFLGYDIFKEAKIRSWCARLPRSRRRPRLLSRLYADLPLSGETRESFFRKFFLWDDDRPSEGLFSTHAARWGSASRMKRFYSKSFKDALDGYDASETLASRLPAAYRGWGPVARAQYLEATLFLSGYLLSSQGDRVSMANGVEVRYPYLDHRLVELANRLPASVKMAGLRDKRLLRSAASGVLPEEIAERPKRPYKAPPLSACLTERLTRHLSPERILRTGIFDETLTGKLLEKAKAAGATLGDSDASALCGIVSAQIFHERFVEGGVA